MELNPGRTLEGVGFTGARLICGMGIAKGSGWEQSQSPGRRVPSCQSPDSRCLRTRTRTQPGGRYSYSIPIPTRRTSPCVHRPEYEYPPRSSRAKDHVDPQSRISAESLRAFSPSYSYSARRAVLVLDPCISSIGSWGHSPICVNLIIRQPKTPCRQVAESAYVGCPQVDEQCADHLTADVAAGAPAPRSTTRSRAPRRTPATDSHSPRVSPQGEKSSASRSTLSINSEVRIFACIHALADASLLFGTCPKSKRLFNLLNTNSTCHRLR